MPGQFACAGLLLKELSCSAWCSCASSAQKLSLEAWCTAPELTALDIWLRCPVHSMLGLNAKRSTHTHQGPNGLTAC